MVKYAFKSDNLEAARTRQNTAPVSFKNTHATARAIRGMNVEKAMAYLDRVLEHKSCVPFYRFRHGVGRQSQAGEWSIDQGRFPEKSVNLIKDLLKQAVGNAKALHKKEPSELFITHIEVQRAAGRRRRTFRAHGSVGKYESQPCHVQLIVAPKAADVEKAKALA